MSQKYFNCMFGMMRSVKNSHLQFLRFPKDSPRTSTGKNLAQLGCSCDWSDSHKLASLLAAVSLAACF